MYKHDLSSFVWLYWRHRPFRFNSGDSKIALKTLFVGWSLASLTHEKSIMYGKTLNRPAIRADLIRRKNVDISAHILLSHYIIRPILIRNLTANYWSWASYRVFSVTMCWLVLHIEIEIGHWGWHFFSIISSIPKKVSFHPKSLFYAINTYAWSGANRDAITCRRLHAKWENQTNWKCVRRHFRWRQTITTAAISSLFHCLFLRNNIASSIMRLFLVVHASCNGTAHLQHPQQTVLQLYGFRNFILIHMTLI